MRTWTSSAFFLLLLITHVGCGAGIRPVQVRHIAPLPRLEVHALIQALRAGNDIPVSHSRDPDPASPQTSIEPALNLREQCAEFTAKLPPGFRFGWVTVPENWSDPQGVQIEVFYYARMVSEGRPTLFLNGGPSSNSHSSYATLDRQARASELSMIYIDQRGTGCSSPYPKGNPDGELIQRLAHYGTRAIVKDAEAVRKVLLGEKTSWQIFGQSYGGFAVHRYLETEPDSVLAAYAHGASLMRDPVEWIALRLRAQKRVVTDYFKTYPSDFDKLVAARSSISPETCFESSDIRICGPQVLDVLTSMLAFQNSWPALHSWLNQLTVPEVLDSFVRNFYFGVFMNEGLPSSVLSLLDMTGGITDRDLCARAERRLLEQGEDTSSWSLNECRVIAASQTPWDLPIHTWAKGLVVNPAISAETLLATLHARPHLAFHLYSGQKDVLVPTESFAEEVALLGPRVKYLNFDFSGHEGFYTEQQVWSDLISP